MRKFNTLLCFIIFGLSSVAITATVLPLLRLLLWNEDRRRLVFTRFIKLSWSIFCQIMETLRLIKISISSEDRQTLASLTSTIIVANHTSLIDIVILISLTKDATCIVKGRLYQNFLIRFILANAFISNDGDPEKLINHATVTLNGGYNLIVFPEGTRTSRITKLQRGTSHIALESLADVLVLRIDPNPPVLRKGKGWHDVAEKQVIYTIKTKTILKPTEIMDAGKSRHVNARRITARINEALES